MAVRIEKRKGGWSVTKLPTITPPDSVIMTSCKFQTNSHLELTPHGYVKHTIQKLR